MYRYLFFDDQKLFQRKNLTRCYGTPQLIPDSVYFDEYSSTDLRTAFVFHTDDGKYRMVYQGKLTDKTDRCLIAVSDDGIHFAPEDTTARLTLDDCAVPHELFRIPSGEIAEVFEDPRNDPNERYKMLMCYTDSANYCVHGVLLTSPDLFHWTQVEGLEWNGGAEPITGVFYNEHRACYTIMVRPDWGVRRVGYVDTKDWRTFTPYELCLQVDSLDAPLDELYGMPSMAYGDRYIGFPHMYRGFESANHSKYHGGTIDAELAYSWDGHHWQRSLRTPFITGLDEQNRAVFGTYNPLLWASAFRVCENGDLLIYTSVSAKEHGPAFSEPGGGRIAVWKVEKDRLIALATESPETEGVLSTRENIWQSGEVHINLACAHATLAVYESRGNDFLAHAYPLAGYAHEDCIPFSGDSTDWVPQFKNGNTLQELVGKTLVLELKMTDGKVFAVSGDFVPAMNLEGARFRMRGIVPTPI